jgi:hypothetical protein
MINHLLDAKSSNRKLQLFGCASCRRVSYMLTVSERRILDLKEDFADGLATDDDIRKAKEADDPERPFVDVYSEDSEDPGDYASSALYYGMHEPDVVAMYACIAAVLTIHPGADRRETQAIDSPEYVAQCSLLRCIFGNPFQRVALNSAWVTSNVLNLAQAIYDEKDFSKMPVLGDALEDAGCDNQDMLSHCRGSTVHARGCWVVDLLLGKE